MRVFKEEQKFNQWWLKLLLGVLLIGTGLALYQSYKIGNEIGKTALGFGIILLVSLFFLVAQLRTKIDQHGITATFFPTTFFTKSYSWAEVEKVYVRKYSAITEYGGWGVRGFFNAKAYNTSGEMGIQIISKKGERFLIGTQKPNEAKKVITRYLKNSEI